MCSQDVLQKGNEEQIRSYGRTFPNIETNQENNNLQNTLNEPRGKPREKIVDIGEVKETTAPIQRLKPHDLNQDGGFQGDLGGTRSCEEVLAWPHPLQKTRSVGISALD